MAAKRPFGTNGATPTVRKHLTVNERCVFHGTVQAWANSMNADIDVLHVYGGTGRLAVARAVSLRFAALLRPTMWPLCGLRSG